MNEEVRWVPLARRSTAEAFTLSLPSGTVQQYRLVLAGARIFILMTAGPTADPDAARSFFESLRF